MSFRAAAVIAASLLLVGVATARDRDGTQLTPARERQKRCSMEWRGLSVADKAAKGPTWPQFYSKCVKRLKAKT